MKWWAEPTLPSYSRALRMTTSLSRASTTSYIPALPAGIETGSILPQGGGWSRSALCSSGPFWRLRREGVERVVPVHSGACAHTFMDRHCPCHPHEGRAQENAIKADDGAYLLRSPRTCSCGCTLASVHGRARCPRAAYSLSLRDSGILSHVLHLFSFLQHE